MKKLVIGFVTLASLSNAAAVFGQDLTSSNDLDRLLRTGSCFNCTIEDADLSGRTLNFDRIENTRFSNVSFRGSRVTIGSMSGVTIESSGFDAGALVIGLIEDSLLQDMSLRSTSVEMREVVQTTLRRIDLSSASFYSRRLADSEFSDLTALSSRWSISDLRDVTWERARLDSSDFVLTAVRGRFEDTSCKSCVFDLGERLRGAGSTFFVGTDLSGARLTHPGTMVVAFEGGTRLEGAQVNSQVCSAGSTDRCE